MPFVAFFVLSCSTPDKREQYILAIQSVDIPDSVRQVSVFRPDTLLESDHAQVFSKAVQRYGAGLLLAKQQLDKDDVLHGIAIMDASGQVVDLQLSQQERDSLIMEFVKFARRSQTPYYDVKDFELKMMTIR